jgi:predicted Fe-Mo cluster-binding NifX family protein
LICNYLLVSAVAPPVWSENCITHCAVMNGTRWAEIAFACRDRRIAPVFDTARLIHVIQVDSGRIAAEWQEVLPDDFPVSKTLRLVELGVRTLVCGAISRPLHAMITSYGIQVVPLVAGELRETIHGWLGTVRWSMPLPCPAVTAEGGGIGNARPL